MTIRFSNWKGPNGLEQYIINKTGCKPYSGSGINYRKDKKTTILRSVDNTEYYDDDLTDVINPKYTLFGQVGDQSENEKKFNEPLLNKNKTEKIFLYRCVNINKKTEYIWYGQYEIIDKNTKIHIGKDNVFRKIIILNLKRKETKEDDKEIKEIMINENKPKNNKSIDYNKYKIRQLKEICKEKGIRGYSKLRKAEIIDLINQN